GRPVGIGSAATSRPTRTLRRRRRRSQSGRRFPTGRSWLTTPTGEQSGPPTGDGADAPTRRDMARGSGQAPTRRGAYQESHGSDPAVGDRRTRDLNSARTVNGGRTG